MTDAERAEAELATVPALGLTVHALQMLTGWEAPRAAAALQELLTSGKAFGTIERRIRLSESSLAAISSSATRGPKTKLRYLPGKAPIMACGWDPSAGTLELIFRTSPKTIYRYTGVSEHDGRMMYDSANCADRMTVFGERVKDRYPFVKVHAF